MPQGPYSLVENAKVMPTIPSLEKIVAVVELAISVFFTNNNEEDAVNVAVLEKIKIIDTLYEEEEDEKNELLKRIDMAISKKKLKDNLFSLIAS